MKFIQAILSLAIATAVKSQRVNLRSSVDASAKVGGVDCGGTTANSCSDCPVTQVWNEGRNRYDLGTSCASSPDCVNVQQTWYPYYHCVDKAEAQEVNLNASAKVGGVDCGGTTANSCSDCPVTQVWNEGRNRYDLGTSCASSPDCVNVQQTWYPYYHCEDKNSHIVTESE